MPKYEVFLEKRMYCPGRIEVHAASPEEAEQMVENQILSRELRTIDVDWDDPIYEDGSFDITGDMDEVE